MPSPKTLNFKLVLLGESAVGKSSIVMRYVNNQFSDDRESTIGAAFLTQHMKVGEDTIKFEIWDTAGQERFVCLAPMYYRNAHAALVVYSLDSKDSFDRAVKWIEELRRQSDTHTIIILAGNKSDIPDDTKQVSPHDAQAVADEMQVEFSTTCSAKSGGGIEQLFVEIGNRLPIEQAKQKAFKSPQQAIKLDKADSSGQTETCAC
ncbi:Ras-related protein Rab-5A [Wallemia ichthyophaga EXF-994]|uniref:Ras-related protein Rab-5A n=2 Tax=Wallemia ichthyophaga TaxID=245174 RepID=R9AC12_WALI9|nr:Ras-related protein Rab-5A [Wallemia ichthyophaga EXF-994]EOQ99677.1 Ras-related protein Rab-5A [Wallemia ichthyophaga EXF-994]TIB33401.1 hypothetical protein E3P84_02199 [Wallemia ichthyophaga]TIB41298.1 hypothetical protein E3P83_02152 [Wallemia ichthyophaga]